MRVLPFVVIAALFGALAWGDSTSATTQSTSIERRPGESTTDAACFCVNLSEDKRLNGNLGGENQSGAGQSEGTARPVQ